MSVRVQSSSTIFVVVVVLQLVTIISAETLNLCESNDPNGYCSGSNSIGLCNPNNFDKTKAVEFQAQLLDYVGNRYYYNSGRSSGCVQTPTTPPVYFYYCCSRFVTGCGACYAKAIKRLKDGCPGRAGGSVLFDKCSLRYELQSFC
ncbi:unnamed protein product [Linum trigynum]|uniref:Gnk2-homologous domain-containing protein n=1 Tax=Linum trigynum TaxID=586398 RepID=A0AAV2CSF8_9ROSI